MKRLNKQIIIAGAVVSSLVLYACNKDFLDKTPIGSLDESTLNNKAGVNGLLIGAYSLLDGRGVDGVDDGDASVWNAWAGNVGADDAHKGGDYASQGDRLTIENKTYTASNGILNARWRANFGGVQRANEVLRQLDKLPPGEFTDEEALQIRAEARFLRGVYHLEAAKMWRNIPYLDETITFSAGNYNVPNTVSAFPKIEEDFLFAAQNLTPTKAQKGRANSWAAKAFLAKTYMFDLKLAEAKPILDDIIANGVTTQGVKYGLVPEFNQLFRAIYENGPETVFAVQMSVNDGATGANGSSGEAFNYPPSPLVPVGGWGHQPSFSLVNSYKTEDGLPMLDTWNDSDVKNDQGIEVAVPFTQDKVTPLDPRLDWTVSRRHIPLHDWGTQEIRYDFCGPYRQKKNVHWKQDEGGVSSEVAGGWQQTNGNNYNLIRFADVLLWAAEVEVEIGSLQKAEDYVNIVRARAANPDGFLHEYINNADPSLGFSAATAANYVIDQYSGEFTANGQEFARKAVRFERKLEFAMEGHRFFDLQRWDLATPGYMAGILNAYMDHERNSFKTTGVGVTYQILEGNVRFIQGKHELYAIPQQQIDLGGEQNQLVQNPGHN